MIFFLQTLSITECPSVAPRFNRKLLTATLNLSAIKVNHGEVCL